MGNANKKAAYVIKKIAEKMADLGYGAASMWGLHQPKEPKKLNTSKK